MKLARAKAGPLPRHEARCKLSSPRARPPVSLLTRIDLHHLPPTHNTRPLSAIHPAKKGRKPRCSSSGITHWPPPPFIPHNTPHLFLSHLPTRLVTRLTPFCSPPKNTKKQLLQNTSRPPRHSRAQERHQHIRNVEIGGSISEYQAR